MSHTGTNRMYRRFLHIPFVQFVEFLWMISAPFYDELWFETIVFPNLVCNSRIPPLMLEVQHCEYVSNDPNHLNVGVGSLKKMVFVSATLV